MARLGDVCKFQSGGTPSKGNPQYFAGKIPWITTVALNGNIVGEDDAVDWITERAIKESAAKIVPANSIMIGTRVGVGKVAINKIPMSTSQDIISLLEIDESKWYKPFICKWLSAQNQYLQSQARGATIKGIKIETIANLEMPELPVENQQFISICLDKVSTLATLRKQQLAKLDESIKARFVEMFGDPVQNPFRWTVKQVKDLAAEGKNSMKAGPFGSSLKKEFYTKTGYKIYGQEQVINGDASYGDYYISEKKYNELESCSVQAYDILISLVGTYGKTLIIPDDFEPGIINPRLIKITFDQSKIDVIYFQNFFASDALAKELDNSTHGCTMGVLNLGIIKELKVPIPPIELQHEFSRFKRKSDEKKLTIQQSLDKLEVLKKSLMQEYFG